MHYLCSSGKERSLNGSLVTAVVRRYNSYDRGRRLYFWHTSAPMTAFRFYWVVFTSGGILMALEILSSRLLAPHFGNSVYVWGSIIGTFLAALSVGYVAGGLLADRSPTMEMLGRLVVIIALCQAVLLLFGERLVAWLGELTGGLPAGTLLATGLLFGPVSILLGMVSPFAVRLAARDLEHLGNTAGRLYALSTAGSLIGTLGSTFVMIPYLQLAQMFALLLLLTALTGLIALGGSWRRESVASLTAIVLLLVALPRLAASSDYGEALYKRITPYQTLQVLEENGVRYLRSDNINHAAIRIEDGTPALSYSQVVPGALLFKPEIERVLVLGMGAGNIGSYLHSARPEIRVDYVDIDPAVPVIARDYFGFRQDETTKVHVVDGRRFLEDTEESWDLILCDTYIGLSVPFHLSTLEFFKLVDRRLTPGGVLGINLAGGVDHPFSRAIYRTVAEQFSSVYLFQAVRSQNVLLFAHHAPSLIPTEELIERGQTLDAEIEFALPLATIARRRVGVDLVVSHDKILRDAFAPVERLIALRPDQEKR